MGLYKWVRIYLMNYYSDLLELIKIFDNNQMDLKDNDAVINLTDILCINKISYTIFTNGVQNTPKVLFHSISQELGENYDFTGKSYNDQVIVLRIYRYQYAADLGELNDLFQIFAQVILNKILATINSDVCDSIIFYDQQYDIHNVNSLHKRLNSIINEGIVQNYSCAFINIIQCRAINSIFGGMITDSIIKTYCQTINSYVDETNNEMLARLGGDNFLFLIHQDRIDEIINKIKEVNVTITQNDDVINYTVRSRMGIVKLNESNVSIPSIMDKVTTAYSMAKSPEYPDIYYYSNDINKSGIEEESYAEDIKKALEDEKFLVYYQPIVSKNNNEINLFSAEALIRWRRQGEMLNPRTFLKIADKYNLICKIDLFVLKTVCIRLKSWIDEGLNPVCIHCNFADSDLLTENLADSIINIIDEYGIHHSLINIEFAESAYHTNKSAFIYTVSKLHSNGIKVSIDNFGKGFTSLELFEYVDFSTLKIDAVIVNSDNSKTKILLSNLINLADNLGIEVICIGANTQNEIERAFEFGCDIFQSEVFEKALSERYFTNRLKNPLY